MNESVLQLESEISSFVNLDNKNNCTVHFEYEKDVEDKGSFNNPFYIASAFTVNPNSKETFLLKQEKASSKEKALKKILEYVKDKSGQNSFTVLWKKTKDAGGELPAGGPLQTSYFNCHDVQDVVEKFFHGKSAANYTVYEIKMNPIA